MLTIPQLAALHRSLSAEWVLSVYVDGTATDPAVQRSWRTQLDNALKDIRDWLVGSSHQEREAFRQAALLLDDVLISFSRTVSAPGWVTFITSDRVVEAHVMPVATPTLAVWTKGPAIAPYLRALKGTRPVIVVVADALKAHLHKYQNGYLEKLETLRARHMIAPASHMGSPPKQGFHSGTRGSSGKDAADKSLLEGRDRMIRECAERATKAAGDEGFVVVGGVKRVTRRIIEHFPDSLRDRALELKSLDVHASPSEVTRAAKFGASELRASFDSRRLAEIAERAGAGGLGAIGSAQTAAALGLRSVRDLYFTKQYREDNAAEAESLVRSALDQNAVIEEVSGTASETLEQAGGIAAGLRFRPTVSSQSNGESAGGVN